MCQESRGCSTAVCPTEYALDPKWILPLFAFHRLTSADVKDFITVVPMPAILASRAGEIPGSQTFLAYHVHSTMGVEMQGNDLIYLFKEYDCVQNKAIFNAPPPPLRKGLGNPTPY